MAYFRCGGGEKHYATISVSTDYLFGETVTCTCADVEYSRTATFSDDGEASFTVNDWGTYTLTADGKTVIVVVFAWYVTYEVEFAGSVEVTLTLEGAKNDTITIKNSDGEIVGTCIFNNATTGQTQIAIPLTGGEYTFVSSVSKALDGSGTAYSKAVALTSETESVQVYPTDNILTLDWYLNSCGNNIEALAIDSSMAPSSAKPSTPVASVEGNARVYKEYNDGHDYWTYYGNVYFGAKIDLSNYSKINIELDAETYGKYGAVSITLLDNKPRSSISEAVTSSIVSAECSSSSESFNFSGIHTFDISSISVAKYVAVQLQSPTYSTVGSKQTTAKIKRLWLE